MASGLADLGRLGDVTRPAIAALFPAQAESALIVDRARADLARERDQAFQELREQVADLAVAAASRVVRRSLDDAAHRELVREFLASEDGARR